MSPLWLLALPFLKNHFQGGAARAPGWPPAKHPPPVRPMLITKHGVIPLDAAAHMPAAAPAAPAETPAHHAAAALCAYLSGASPNWGFPGRPSAAVREAQAALGVTADGIYGPKTRAACVALGVPCPARPSAANIAKGAALNKAKSLTSRLIPRIP